MKIYIDESGDFNSKEGKLNFYTSICIFSNDGNLEIKENSFKKWKSNIPNNFFNKKGEVKGNKLKPGQLLSFVNDILLNKPILVRPFCINPLDTHEIEYRRETNNKQISEGIDIYEKQGKKELVNRYKKLRSRYNNLSNEQYIKVEMLMLVIFETFYDFFIYSILNKYDTELGDLEIFIDIDKELFKDIGEKRDYRRRLFRDGLYAWSYKKPIPRIKEWDNEHPFIKLISKNGKENLSETIFKNRLHFKESDKEIGLQIADIVSNLFYKITNKDKITQFDYLIKQSVDKVRIGNLERYVLTGNKDNSIPNPYLKTPQP